MRTLEQFISDPGRAKREWVDAPGFACMYVRLGPKGIVIDGRCETFEKVLQLAAFEVEEKGQGTFTRFITKLMSESEYPIFVESVLEERFRNFFERMGFTKVDDSTICASFFYNDF
jgi:hypothetical protein